MDEDLKREIGQRVKKVRKEKRLTQSEIVSHFRCGRSNYSKIESGEIMPGGSLMVTLHSKFNVSLDWLITGKGPMYIKDHKQLNFGDYSEDMQALIVDMVKDKAVMHAVLSYYYTYKADKKKNNKNPAKEVINEP